MTDELEVLASQVKAIMNKHNYVIVFITDDGKALAGVQSNQTDPVKVAEALACAGDMMLDVAAAGVKPTVVPSPGDA
jgi:hypothetical protein